MTSVRVLRNQGDAFVGTMSGARICPITGDSFGPLLAQFGETGVAALDAHAVWGAFEPDGALLGIAYLNGILWSSTRAGIAVTPSRRRLGIGTELLEVLVHDAGVRGLKTLKCVHDAHDPVPQLFLESQDLALARRIHLTEALTIAIVPVPTFDFQ